MILLAHDGSLYGEWVSRYALNFALGEDDRRLLVLHVCDGKHRSEVVDARFERLVEDCRELQVGCTLQKLPLAKSVYRSLRQALPHDSSALLICGTRLKPRGNSFLRGSVAEQLLRMHQCPVLAVRVVQPGLLGSPQQLLLPLAGHSDGFVRIRAIFRRLQPNLRRVHLFRSLYVHPLRHPYLSPARERMLLDSGQAYLEKIVAEMAAQLVPEELCVERLVNIANDWPNAVLVQASRLKVQMILLGVSERSLAHRVVYGVGLERMLREAPCDVGIYRGP